MAPQIGTRLERGGTALHHALEGGVACSTARPHPQPWTVGGGNRVQVNQGEGIVCKTYYYYHYYSRGREQGGRVNQKERSV